MKGYIPIEIPTKRYIKAFILSQLGDKPVIDRYSVIGEKLSDLLSYKTNSERTKFSSKLNVHVRVYISYRLFKNRGCRLNETNLMYFNSFMEDYIKELFYFYMDFFIEILPSFKTNLPTVRKLLGIDDTDWDDDAMQKDYYRYRKRKNKVLLYKKKNIGADQWKKNPAFNY